MRATVRPVVLWLLLIPLAFATSSAAQSFLGSIRGTVVDPQGAAVKGAAVLDHRRGDRCAPGPRDRRSGPIRGAQPPAGHVQGRSHVAELQEVREDDGPRAAPPARRCVDVTLEVGGVNETITVSGEAANNITLDSQAISRGLDAQQLHDLPRSSRDIQSFLLLNPNVVGGSDDIQFLGAKTYGVSYIQDGQASTNAIFGTVGNSAPGLDAVEELQVLSNSYSAEYGGLAGVVVTTKRGGQQYRGTAFFDYNADGLNALTYNQTLSGVERGDPHSDTHEHRWGGSLGGPLLGSKLFFFGNYEGSNDKAIYGGGRATVPTAAMRARRLQRQHDRPQRSRRRASRSPGSGSPPDRIDPAAQKIMDFFYPLPNQENNAAGYGVFQQFVPETRKRHRFDLRLDSRADQERLALPPRQLSTPRSAEHHIRGGERADQHAHPRVRAEHGIGHRRLDEDLLLHDGQRVPGRLQLRQLEARRATSRLATCAASSASRTRPA